MVRTVMKPRLLRTSLSTAVALFLISNAAPFLAADNPPTSTSNSTGLKIPAPPPAKGGWMSHEAADVLKLVRANVTEDVVMAYIQTARAGFNLSADEIVQLHNEGVSDKMIQAMLERKKQAPQPAISVVQQAPAPEAQQQQQPLPGATQVPQQPIVVQPGTPAPQVTYVQNPPVYVGAPTYVYREPIYTYYDSYPYYWGGWYPSVSFNFGLRSGYYGRYGYAHSYGGYRGSYHGGFSGGYRGGSSGGWHGAYSGGFHGGGHHR
jgi:hypothetical protein